MSGHPVVSAIAAFALLPNLPYLIALGDLAPSRALLNVDYLFLGAVGFVLPPLLTGLGFALLMVIDAFTFVARLYHFTPGELIRALEFGRFTPIGLGDIGWWVLIASLIPVVTAIFVAVQISRARRVLTGMTCASLLVFAVSLDVLDGTNTVQILANLPFFDRIQVVPVNLATSGIMKADFRLLFRPSGFVKTMERAQSALAIARTDSISPGTNIALIIVESWGQILGNAPVSDSIVAPLLSDEVRARYQITRGTIPFRGSTTHAELRELCGLDGDYHDLIKMRRQSCLTDTLAASGYDITGVHGFSGEMFDRESWWPLLGIRRMVFQSELKQMGFLRECGTAFPGICDADLIEYMGKLFSERSNRLVYALTLNSHLPLAKTVAEKGDFDCARSDVTLTSDQCALAVSWHKIFIATENVALRTDLYPTQFVIVGDHTPPLMARRSSQLFDPSRVPYLILTPKN